MVDIMRSTFSFMLSSTGLWNIQEPQPICQKRRKRLKKKKNETMDYCFVCVCVRCISITIIHMTHALNGESFRIILHGNINQIENVGECVCVYVELEYDSLTASFPFPSLCESNNCDILNLLVSIQTHTFFHL